MVKTFSTSIVIGLISVLVLAQPQVAVLGQSKTQGQSTESKSTSSPTPSESPTQETSSSPTPSKTPTQETSSSPTPSETPTQETSSLLNPPLIISMISLMVGLINLIVLIYFVGLDYPRKYKYFQNRQDLFQKNLDSIKESLEELSNIIEKLNHTNASYYHLLNQISQQIQQASYREPSSQKSPPGKPMPKDPRHGIVDYQSVIDQFNANNSNWFREQIESGFFQKVQANETQGYAGRVIQISLQPSGSLLKYKVNGTEWVIPDRTQELWHRAVRLLFHGYQPNSSLIKPAELEQRGNIWQVKEPGQFQ